MAIFVITNPENGWDCVCGVYEANSKKEVANSYVHEKDLNNNLSAIDWMEENNYIIHKSNLEKIN